MCKEPSGVEFLNCRHGKADANPKFLRVFETPRRAITDKAVKETTCQGACPWSLLKKKFADNGCRWQRQRGDDSDAMEALNICLSPEWPSRDPLLLYQGLVKENLSLKLISRLWLSCV